MNKETMNLNKYIQAYNKKRGAIQTELIQTELKPIKRDIINTISDAVICLDLAEPGYIEILDDNMDNHIIIHIPLKYHDITLRSLNEMINTLQLDEEQVFMNGTINSLILKIPLDRG